MAAACGIGVANIYYNQPLLVAIGSEFHREAGYLPTVTQIGAGLGMLLFVPLGDTVERRRLITLVCLATATSALLTALAPSLPLLLAASFLLGLCSVVPHLILPFAAQIASPSERGKVLGTVLSGLLIGILLARTVSGFLGAWIGWRSVYWMAAGCMVLLSLSLRLALPKSEPVARMGYGKLLFSMLQLVQEKALLRESSLIGAMLFGAFSVFWATLIFVLVTPPFHAGSRLAGTFGLIGAVGALAANVAGRIADRRGPRFTVGVGIGTTLLSYVAMFAIGRWMWGLVAGCTLLDLGVQTGHVANQTRIYSMEPELRSRLNTVYMVSYFAGGATGSALGAYGWYRGGWLGVCCAGTLLSSLALVVHLYGKPKEPSLNEGVVR